MGMLIAGVALWWLAHLFKRIAPDARARMGNAGKGAVALVLILAVVLMVWGYRAAPPDPFWWGASGATKGINNLLMLFAFYLYAADGMKTRITRVIRHPQLTAFSIWAFAHILPNGDLPSLILFGGLLAWALLEMAVLNARTTWTPPPVGPVKREIMAVVGALVVYGVVAAIHIWAGVNPFGG